MSVAPFKPQNMSNNAAVTADGGEIGRAQALQARAAGLKPHVDMNPVLLKPQSEIGAQIVVAGKVFGTAKAREFQNLKKQLLPHVVASFGRLKETAEIVLVEGAGSASEINLRANDIANMGFARAAQVPVVLIGDIDRGGVIASLVGTKTVLDPKDAAMIVAFLVNRMRGDATLFADGMAAIADMTGWASLGLIPYFADADRLPAEDAYGLAERAHKAGGKVRIAVPVLPRIANFDDLDPLAAEPDVMIDMIEAGRPIPLDADLVVLPGSKATLADHDYLRAQGWDIDIAAIARRGGHVLGICGGYQMLGTKITDVDGIEGPTRDVAGLGLLQVETALKPRKDLREAVGTDRESGMPVRGYEIHMGETRGPNCARPMFQIGADARPDGAVSESGRIRGTYVHGLFTSDKFRARFLSAVKNAARAEGPAFEAMVERVLDGLADHLEAHLDLDKMLEIARAR
jgi:adenosylcobyric acid synthase